MIAIRPEGEDTLMHGEHAFDPNVERDHIRQRRERWGERQPSSEALPPEHPVGLAFSGGGIRSAIFSLGLAQALARKRLFPQIDYLSTVSGGGYAGAFIGTLFLPRRRDLTLPDPLAHDEASDFESPRAAAERAERLLSDDAHATTARVASGDAEATIFHPLRWLRENGRYLTPSGARDLLFLAAFYLRSLVGVHYVLGLVLIGAAIGMYALRLALHILGQGMGGALAPRLDGLDWDLAIGAAALAAWWSPILWLVPAVLLAAGGPLALAYWFVFRQERRDRLTAEERAIKLAPYWLLLASAIFAVLLARFDHWSNPVVFVLAYGAYLALASLALLRFWLARLLQPGEDWTHTAAVARARLALTKALTAALAALLVAAACGLVDSFGQTLFVAYLRNRPGELLAVGSAGGAIALLLWAARRFGEAAFGADASALRRALDRMQKLAALAVALAALTALAALAVAVVQWVAWSPWLFELRVKAQAVLRPGHFALLFGLILAWALLAALVRESLGFLNNSTFHRFYCARLVRTFLGAANFKRLKEFQDALQDPLQVAGARKLFVSETHPHDDVALRSYYGRASAAPLHVLSVTLNESLSQTSSLVREDRKGVALAVGPAGINVDDRFYRWAQPAREIGSRLQVDDPGLPTANADAAEPDEPDRQRACERLSLGAWAAISGAAVSTGLGRASSLGFSVLAWLVNARLAYWWQPAARMSTQRRESAWKTFDLVRQELTGGFYGQRGLYWNLSDGGHFENTGVYELLRRRAALIVCADNGADPDYRFGDVQNLVRRARIDLGAEIEFLDETALREFVAQAFAGREDAGRYFGTMEQLRDAAARGDRCALVARVRYAPRADGLAEGALLVVIKPVLTAFAPIDVKLYAAGQPAFPQQSTGDQFFDEAQWESYRKLGEAIGRRVFDLWPGFVAMARRWAAAS